MFDINKASLSNLIEKVKFETSASKIQKNLNCELVVLPTLKPYIDKAWTWLQSQKTMYANEEHTLAEVLSEFVCADVLAAIITDKVKCYDDKKNSSPRSSLSDYAIWLFGQKDLNLFNRANAYPHVRKLHEDNGKKARYNYSWMEKDFMRVSYLLYNYADKSSIYWAAILPLLYDNPWFVYALEKRDRLYTELKKPQQSKNKEDIDYSYFEDEYESLSDEAEECMVRDFVQLLGLEEEKYDDTLMQILTGLDTVYGIAPPPMKIVPDKFAKYPCVRMFWRRLYHEYGDAAIDHSGFQYMVCMTALIICVNKIIQGSIQMISEDMDIKATREIPWIEEAKEKAFNTADDTWNVLSRPIYWCCSFSQLTQWVRGIRSVSKEIYKDDKKVQTDTLAVRKAIEADDEAKQAALYQEMFQFLKDSATAVVEDKEDTELDEVMDEVGKNQTDRYSLRAIKQFLTDEAMHPDITGDTTITELGNAPLLEAQAVIQSSAVWWKAIHQGGDFQQIKKEYRDFLRNQLGISERSQ